MSEKKLGLNFEEFLTFLASVALECKWFLKEKEKARDGVRDKKTEHQMVLALLHWLESSKGKDKINRIRGSGLIPRFIFTSKATNFEELSTFIETD